MHIYACLWYREGESTNDPIDGIQISKCTLQICICMIKCESKTLSTIPYTLSWRKDGGAESCQKNWAFKIPGRPKINIDKFMSICLCNSRDLYSMSNYRQIYIDRVTKCINNSLCLHVNAWFLGGKGSISTNSWMYACVPIKGCIPCQNADKYT